MIGNDKWLVAVTAGRWQRHGIQEARKAGLKVLGIDADPQAEGFEDADKFLCISFDDHAAIIDAIRNLKLNICGSVSFCSEAGMLLTAKIREAFNLPGPRMELTQKLLDKGEQRKVWTKENVPGPQWAIFEDASAALELLRHTILPVIIKPTDSSGSRGVTKIESINDDLVDAVERAFRFSKSNQVIIESYMDGTEFTVESFVIDGKPHVLAVTEKKKVAGTNGTVASELATPVRPAAIVESIKQCVIDALNALGYTEGPGHAEVILMKDDSVGMVELAGRGGGFMVFNALVPAVSGVNIARLTALQAVGMPVSIDQQADNAAVLRFFPSRPGILSNISGFEEANAITGVQAAPFVTAGINLQKAIADGDRLGYILTSAATPQQARELADAAEKRISFKIDQI